MHATVHALDGVPGPQDHSWVDAVLATLGHPTGALIGRPLGLGPGRAVAFGTATAGTGAAGPVRVGPGTPYTLERLRTGTSAGPARYLQVVTFDRRGEDWGRAFDRPGEERVWPAVRALPGLVAVLTGSGPDGDRIAFTLTDSVESLEAGSAAILSTTLLPWEDPAHLTGPDTLVVLRLLHAELPALSER